MRELRNVVERAVYRWDDGTRPVEAIDFDPFASPWAPGAAAESPTHAPAAEQGEIGAQASAAPKPLRARLAAYERGVLEEALAAARHNQRTAARALGLTYDQFRHALRRHGLLPGRERAEVGET